jgi:hypothetical protein
LHFSIDFHEFGLFTKVIQYFFGFSISHSHFFCLTFEHKNEVVWGHFTVFFEDALPEKCKIDDSFNEKVQKRKISGKKKS